MTLGEMKKEHTLKVVGHGKVMLMPDEVEIVFFLQQTDKSFAKAQQRVKVRFAQLEQMVLDFGLPRTALQMLAFETGKAMEHGIFRHKMKGYSCYCEAKLVFALNRGLLEQILLKLTASVEEMPYRIRYRLRDETIDQANLLGLAAADARRKANQLAEGLGTELGEIVNVEFNRTQKLELPRYVADHHSFTRFEGVMDMIMPWEDDKVVTDERRCLDNEPPKHEGAEGSYVPQPIQLEADVKVEWSFAERGTRID